MEYNHQKYDEFIADIINKRGQWNIPEDEYKEMASRVREVSQRLINGDYMRTALINAMSIVCK